MHSFIFYLAKGHGTISFLFCGEDFLGVLEKKDFLLGIGMIL